MSRMILVLVARPGLRNTTVLHKLCDASDYTIFDEFYNQFPELEAALQYTKNIAICVQYNVLKKLRCTEKWQQLEDNHRMIFVENSKEFQQARRFP